MKILKDDTVKVLNGKDRGKSGLVFAVFPNDKKIQIKGIHMLKKHVKPSKKNPTGGIIEINKKVDVSNVALVCPNCGKNTKIGYKDANKQKIRICRKCHQSVNVRKDK